MKKQWLIKAFSNTLSPSSTFLSRSFCSTTTTKTSTFAVKKVTKSNFPSALDDLRTHVREADFVAIDLEMTGINSAPWRESLPYDSCDIKYLKVKDSADKFAVVQFGVCPFRWDSKKHLFVAQPYTFYIFPRYEFFSDDSPSCEFLCETKSVEFLAKHKFDFNAWIYEGISYSSKEQKEENVGSSNVSNDSEELTSIADILFTERMKSKFVNWRDSLLRNITEGSRTNGSNIQFKTVFYKNRPAVEIDGFTSRQIRLIQMIITKDFKDLAYICTSGDISSRQTLVVYAGSEDKDMLTKQASKNLVKDTESKSQAAAGFRQVIDLLSSEKKLIVGHNCFLDIAHIYRKFFGPLPSTVEEFVSSVHKNFSYIIDTKYLMNANVLIQLLMRNHNTSLSSAFSFFCPQMCKGFRVPHSASQPRLEVEVQVDELSSSNWNSEENHEAGYDSFMTGCIFAQACSYIGIDFKLQNGSNVLSCNETLKKFVNRLYINWENGDTIDLSTGKTFVESCGYHSRKTRHPKAIFDNIAIIWGFPSTFKPNNLKQVFCKVFGNKAVTSVYLLDSSAAFVQFKDKIHVSVFLSLKERLEKTNDTVSALSKLLEGGNTCAAHYEVYKDICRSPVSEPLFADQANAVTGHVKFGVTQNPVSLKSTSDTDQWKDSSSNNKSLAVELMESLFPT